MKRILLAFLIILCLSFSLFACNKSNDSLDTSIEQEGSSGSDSGNSSDSDKGAVTDTSADSSIPRARDDEVSKENMKFILKGIVKAVSTGIEIEVIESDYAYGIYYVIIPSNTPITDSVGNALSLSDLKENDTVLVEYGGQTMLSYPPQIVAYSIIVQ